MKKHVSIFLIVGILLMHSVLVTHFAYAEIDSGEVPEGWAVWSSWYWPFHNEKNPNLYDANEAMDRYDDYDPGANAKTWEYNQHGPPQEPEAWWGHCHAWAGAAAWEKQPDREQVSNGVRFRVQDLKGLMTELYHTCADGTKFELFADDPSPGLFWRYLRDELRGDDALHDHGMSFVGELYYGDRVWNYAIYKYAVDYSETSPYSGTMNIWVAGDGQASYANSTSLHDRMFPYQFQGVIFDGKDPVDSGTWLGTGEYHRPDAIWRPYYPATWTEYVGNSHLNETRVGALLSGESSVEGNKEYKRIVTIPGNTQWKDSGIPVSAGDVIKFSSRGTIVYDNEGYACGPDGTIWNDTRNQKDPLWQQPHAGVIGKIGGTEVPFFIGETQTVTAGNSGKLFLGINDYWYHGNSGKFTVKMLIQKR